MRIVLRMVIISVVPVAGMHYFGFLTNMIQCETSNFNFMLLISSIKHLLLALLEFDEPTFLLYCFDTSVKGK